MSEAFSRGEWVAGTKPFPAKYATRCAVCRDVIAVGQSMVGVFSITVPKAWLHQTCADAAGIPSFVGKPQRRR
jgi:hypothetical protein